MCKVKVRVPTIVLFALWFAFGCAVPVDAPAPAERPDPATYCDYCSVDFSGPTCQTGAGDGSVSFCEMPDGTFWQRKLNGQEIPVYRRYRHEIGGGWTDLCICDATTCGATGAL
jgi:hypothetical protein